MKKLLLLGNILIVTSAFAFGGGGNNRTHTWYRYGVDSIGVHIGDACPQGSSKTGQGGETGIYDSGVMCKCIEADKVYTVNGCELQPEVCTDHTINQCGLGYYCRFSPSDYDDSDRGTGTCTAISGGTQVDAHWVSSDPMDRFSADSWCVGKGSSGSISALTALKEYGCHESDHLCNYYKLKNKGLTRYYWVARDDDHYRCFRHYIYVQISYSRAGFYDINECSEGNFYALCE